MTLWKIWVCETGFENFRKKGTKKYEFVEKSEENWINKWLEKMEVVGVEIGKKLLREIYDLFG